MENFPEKYWEIQYQCPQCGAPATLDENDRLFRCPFCRVKLFFSTRDYFRYYLSPHDGSPPDILYAPYWRIRGTYYTCRDDGVSTRSVDLTALATGSLNIAVSQGLRPRVLPLRFVSPEVPGIFLPQEQPVSGVISVAAKPFKELMSSKKLRNLFAEEMDSPVYLEMFAGETLSAIYAPYFIRDGIVYDAITGERASMAEGDTRRIEAARDSRISWRVKFFPALCPDCGWELAGEKDTIVTHCENCSVAWCITKEGLQRLGYGVSPGGSKDDVYLPFWTVEAIVEGLNLSTYGEFMRFANILLPSPGVSPGDAFTFVVPAFRVYPSLFLRIARLATVAQPGFHENARITRTGVYPVTLPAEETEEFLKILIAEFTVVKKKVFPRLGEISIKPVNTRLLYVPFKRERDELVHPDKRLAINRRAIDHGRLL